MLTELKQYMDGYAKGSKDVFNQLVNQLTYAIHNARRALDQANENHTDNPSTTVHELVEFLQKIKP